MSEITQQKCTGTPYCNWVPKIDYWKKFGRPIFLGLQYTQITTINMYLLIEIRHKANFLLVYLRVELLKEGPLSLRYKQVQSWLQKLQLL